MSNELMVYKPQRYPLGLLFYTGVWVGSLTKISVYAFEIMRYSLQ